jgi:hypothetical protein
MRVDKHNQISIEMLFKDDIFFTFYITFLLGLKTYPSLKQKYDTRMPCIWNEIIE